MPAHGLTRRAHVPAAVPLFGGACVAVASAVLLNASFLWTVMFFGVCAVLIPALLVKDRILYWLTILLATVPFDVSKTFMNSDRGIALIQQVGGTGGPFAPELRLVDLALVPLVVAWLARKILRRERIAFPRISYVPLAFLCFVTLTATVAPLPRFAFLALLRQWKYFVIYVLVTDTIDVRKLGKPILTIFLLTLLLQAGLTIARYEFQIFTTFFGESLGRLPQTYVGEAEGTRRVDTTVENSAERGFGTFYHANTTALHLELLLPFAAALLLVAPRAWRPWRAAAGILAGLGTLALYVTFSRAGLIAFLFATASCILFAGLRGMMSRRRFLSVVAAGALVTICSVPVVIRFMATRPSEAAFHVTHLRHGITIALRHPIFGVGLNNSSAVRPYLVPRDLTYEESQLPVHSGHIVGIAEMGVVGYGLYLWFFVLVGIAAFRRLNEPDVIVRIFSLAVLGALVAMAVHLATDYIGIDSLNALLWLYAGLIVGQQRQKPPVQRTSMVVSPRVLAASAGPSL
jgi:hypothetical protein